MMTVNECLERLEEMLDTEEFDACEENQLQWEGYDDDDDSIFEGICEELGITIH